MRTIAATALALALGVLLWSPAAQAQSNETPEPLKLSEFRLYFIHLANLDAAADKVDAEGTPGDTAAWRRFEQEKAGLTETEAALLKDVAFRCNRTLAGDLEGAQPLEVVRQAVDELRQVLGSSAFEAVSRRIKTFLRPAITNVPAAVQEGTQDDEIPVEVEATAGPSVSVFSLLIKLQDGSFMAQCATSPNDNDTINQYAGGVTLACTVNGGGLSAPIQVPCAGNSVNYSCSETYPPAPANRTRALSATHGLRMKLVSNVCQIPFPVLYDPLAFCRIDSLPPHFYEDGDVGPRENGTATCYDPEVVPNICRIATTSAPQISWIYISPKESTAEAGGTVKFSTFMDATWSTDGPGTITKTGPYTASYTAPATVTSEQTVTIKGCDAYAPGDCDTSTVTLKPLRVDVVAEEFEVLPEGQTTLTAAVVPSAQGQELEWTMSPAVGTLTPSGNSATYKAPANDALPGAYEITVKACLKPALTVCGTAKVLVPKIQMFFNLSQNKETLALDEKIQLTAVVHGPTVPRTLAWDEPSEGLLHELSPADNYARIYQAPPYPSFTGHVDVKACIEGTQHCATRRFNLPVPLRLDAITSDSGRWQAGTKTFFTITGRGFVNPTVALLPLNATVTLTSPTSIRGYVFIPASISPASLEPTVAVEHSNGHVELQSLGMITPEPAKLAVTPPGAEIRAGQSLQFGASCQTSTSQPCTSGEIPGWTALPVGTVSPAGGLSTTYTAPATVANSTAVTLTACWNTGAGGCAAAQITLLPPQGPVVTVSPKTVSLQPGQTQQFTAQVTNSTNTAVNWSISPQTGTISQSGLYTAPSTFGGAATVTVTATSQADATRKDTATVTLVPAPLTLTSTPSPARVNHGTTLSWTATASGGTGTGLQYALFRKRSGTADWIPSQASPAWQPGNFLSWATGQADVGTWDILIWVKDSGTSGNGPGASHNPGPVQVVAPLSVTCTPSPAHATAGTAINWTATGSGGTGVGRQYALFRLKHGTSSWIPNPSTPAWQPENALRWTPGADDVGTWTIVVWFRDANTPADANGGWGYDTYCVPGQVQVVAPLTLTSTPSPAAAYSGQPITWTLSTTGGVPGTVQYHWSRRRAGTSDWISSGWLTSNEITWTPSSTEAGSTWEIAFIVKDILTTPTQNGYGYAAWYNPGPVQVVPPMTLTGTVSPATATYGTTITFTASAGGGTGVSRQYAFFRRRAGTTVWTPSVNSPQWQASNVASWTTVAGDVGTWEAYVWVKDSATPPGMNGYGYAAGYNFGPVQVIDFLTLTSTPSPALADYGTAITWTATANGGTGTGLQYALFRKRSGTNTWIPAQSTPAWQTSNVLSWTPGSGDVGTWDILLWVKDSSVPGNGYANSYNPGPVQVVAPLSVTGTSSPSAVYHGNAVTWTVTGSGGTGAGRQYALFRLKSGASNWIPSPSTPDWQTNNVLSWTPGPGDVGSWTIVVWYKDANTPASANGGYGYATYYNPGPVQVYAHPSVSGTGSPASVTHGTGLTWTATGSGGTGSAKQYALFRKKVGTSTWIPAITAPAWQPGNVLGWTPGAADVGTWEIVVWMKDADTPPAMNGYGYAAYYNAGPVEVTGPLSVSCSSSPVSSTYGNALSWTAWASGGHAPTIQYAFFRKKAGTATWIPAVTSPAWQSGNVMNWTPGSGDVGAWETSIWVRDGNTPGNGSAASCSPGTVQVTAPLSLSGTGSPSQSPYGETLSWTAWASGGHPPTTQYALFRRLAGSSTWIPSLNSPAWQPGNTLSWTPGEGDVGTWEIFVWVRDGSTPPTMNTHGFAAYYNAGPVEVTAPIYQYYAPTGWVDGVDNQWIWGWACDPDYPWESNRVDIWTTDWQYLGQAEANGWSSAPINSACGGGYAHYFSFYHGGSIPSGTEFMVWSIDLPYATPGNDNRPIGGNNSTWDGTVFVMP